MNSSKVRRLRHWLSRERLTSIKGFPLAFVLRNPPKLYPIDLQVVAEKMNENFPSPLPAGEFWGARGGSLLLCSSHTLCLFYTKRLDDPRHLLPIIWLLSLSQIDVRGWIFCQSGTKDLWFVSYIMIYLFKIHRSDEPRSAAK